MIKKRSNVRSDPKNGHVPVAVEVLSKTSASGSFGGRSPAVITSSQRSTVSSEVTNKDVSRVSRIARSSDAVADTRNRKVSKGITTNGDVSNLGNVDVKDAAERPAKGTHNSLATGTISSQMRTVAESNVADDNTKKMSISTLRTGKAEEATARLVAKKLIDIEIMSDEQFSQWIYTADHDGGEVVD